MSGHTNGESTVVFEIPDCDVCRSDGQGPTG
jgi:hypothetical protein